MTNQGRYVVCHWLRQCRFSSSLRRSAWQSQWQTAVACETEVILWPNFPNPSALVRVRRRMAFLTCGGSPTAYGFRGGRTSPLSGRVLVVSNHQSHFDRPGRHGSSAADELPRPRHALPIRPFRSLSRSLDAIPIDREGLASGDQGVAAAVEAGRDGAGLPGGDAVAGWRSRPVSAGFHRLGRAKRGGHPSRGDRGGLAAWPRGRSFRGWGGFALLRAPLPPEEIRGRDERELLVEVERGVHAIPQAEESGEVSHSPLRERGQGEGIFFFFFFFFFF